ncbi:ABC transporter permease [Corynebacterium heidelbergense]|uniref:ABC transporter permease n=1 Tax=Corynebacterium heidelbergense TaxID=2055947 RepID=A0A364V581_9CORY|nr:ABC transporter permease [Corynebacterium heidelbergense]RAV31766.1 ABC transporter permease [Corynebacterium heidelbergense]
MPSQATLCARYTGLELKRTLADKRILVLAVLVPMFMYFVIAGTNDEEAMNSNVGHGTVKFLIATSMALYGTVTVAGAQCANIAAERDSGWLRTLSLSPMSTGSYLLSKALVAVVLSLVPVAAVCLLAAATGAKAEWFVWPLSFLLSLTGAVVFGLIGLILGMLFDPGMINRLIGFITVIFSFLGNLFIPLSGTMLTVAKFTPLFGPGMLVRYPAATEGRVIAGAGTLPLWQPVLNVVVYTVIFAVIARLTVRRGLARQ